MNKLHRFLRQRSAPATGSPPPTISITKNDDDAQIKNSVTLKVPLLSKSEGNTAVICIKGGCFRIQIFLCNK